MRPTPAASVAATVERGRIALAEGGSVLSLLLMPPDARALLVFAHGAGAGAEHATLATMATALAGRRIGTLRFNFPYMEAGRPRTDPQPRAVAAINDAFVVANQVCRTAGSRGRPLPLFLGGHSFGGRMATHAAAEMADLARGLVLCSFPLHTAGKPGVERATHLARITQPMLFVSGTRDALATPALLEATVAKLKPRGHIHWLHDADHGYKARVRERKDPRSVLEELADAVADFVTRTLA